MISQSKRYEPGPLLPALALSILPFSAMPMFAQETATATSEFAAARPANPSAPHRPPGTDTVSYWYGSNYRTPFVLKPNSSDPANIQRHSLEYKHTDFWALGSNFIDVTLAKSNMAEPAAGGGDGATEAYVTIRSNFGLNEITGNGNFKFGPVRNVAIEVGANLQTKNSSFAPSERTIYFGPNIQLAVPRGYFNIGLHLRKEWIHEGPLGKVADYHPDFNIEPSWMIPFSIGKTHLAYSGFADFNTPKGKDTFGTDSVSEFLIRSAVSVDIGSPIMHRAQLLELNGGLWYWHNEYGKPASKPGAAQTSPIIGLTIHLDGGRPLSGK
jgi:hypothetical protein